MTSAKFVDTSNLVLKKTGEAVTHFDGGCLASVVRAEPLGTQTGGVLSHLEVLHWT